MSKLPFDLIIFDCDGTLVDSEYLNNLATSICLTELGYSQFTVDYALEHFLGLNQSAVFAKAAAEIGHALPTDILTRYIQVVQDNNKEFLKPCPNALHVVSTLASRTKICVASNGERPNVVTSMVNTGLFPFVENSIYTAAQVAKPKPAPDLFLFAAAQNDTRPEHCWVIEDSLPGALAGLAAGMRVIGYTGVHHHPAEQKTALMDAGVETVIHDLADLLPLIL